MDKPSKIVLIITIVALICSAAVSFVRHMVFNDFAVMVPDEGVPDDTVRF